MAGNLSDYQNKFISGNLAQDIKAFKDIFKNDATLRVKQISARKCVQFDAALLYIDGMVDSNQLNEAVIEPLMEMEVKSCYSDLAEYVEKQLLFARDVKTQNDISKILEGILYGEALLLIDRSETALMLDVKGWRTRGIKEPENERIIQGPREGFEEAALLNLAMLRRKLQTPDLCIELTRVGRRTNTAVFICYLGELVNRKTLRKIKESLSRINIDGILDTNYIIEEISPHPLSLFKTAGTTERPDVVAARLLEGRIAVIVDGTPMVMTLPYLFSENFQSDEDYYQSFWLGSLGRIMRYFCFLLSIITPALFVAITTLHPEFLPTSFVITVLEQRAAVPFSIVSETLGMILIFEILKETGVRMPQNIGPALSIVGGLVVGQAAVEAKIISTPTLIIVALSGIAGLMLPRLRAAVFFLRFGFVILSAFFGLYGLFSGVILLLMYTISLKSYDTAYTLELNKISLKSLKDSIWRAPWKIMLSRPIFNKNIIRQKRK
ncbi:MAG: spore germination protein [Clostridia bacterium]|nr:spore germination protein [Clostridia bacterium]